MYARQAKDTELIEYATEIRLRAERRAGELLAGMEKAKGTRGQARGSTDGSGGIILEPLENDNPPTLAEMGISKKQSSQWQKLAGLGESEFETHVEEVKQRTVRSTTYSPDLSDDEWFTPVEIIEAVRDVLGTIDLDPASCDDHWSIHEEALFRGEGWACERGDPIGECPAIREVARGHRNLFCGVFLPRPSALQAQDRQGSEQQVQFGNFLFRAGR